jgi:hypothetical protein
MRMRIWNARAHERLPMGHSSIARVPSTKKEVVQLLLDMDLTTEEKYS